MDRPTEPLRTTRPGTSLRSERVQWPACRPTRVAAPGVGVLALAAVLLVLEATLRSQSQSIVPASRTGSIAPAEFTRLSRDFSEEGGYFFSDNFTSNESAYLYILGPLKQYS